MGDEEREELVVDVADALTLDQEVDWDRCARQATAANRGALDNLRLIAEVFAGSRAAGDAMAAASPPTLAGRLVRLAVRVLLGIAAVEVAAALLLLPWAWDAYHGELGDLAVYLAVLLVGCALSACLLLVGGRQDRRTWLLGACFLLQATLVSPFALLASLLGRGTSRDLGCDGRSWSGDSHFHDDTGRLVSANGPRLTRTCCSRLATVGHTEPSPPTHRGSGPQAVSRCD